MVSRSISVKAAFKCTEPCLYLNCDDSPKRCCLDINSSSVSANVKAGAGKPSISVLKRSILPYKFKLNCFFLIYRQLNQFFLLAIYIT